MKLSRVFVLITLLPGAAWATPHTISTPAAPGGQFRTVKTVPPPAVNPGAGKVAFAPQVKLQGSAHEPQEVILHVPPALQKSRLSHIELRHSQNLADKTQPWSGKKGDRDTTAPYSKIEVHVEGRGWTDLGQPKKFAEARPEVERLHDLPDAKGAISAVRVRNVGTDPVTVHDLTLHFLPPKPKSLHEARFTPTMSFGDAWKEVAPQTGRVRDAQVKGTRYPGSITLNNNGSWEPTSKETQEVVKTRGWTLAHDTLSIPLEPGKRFRLAEVAIGDTQPDAAKNGDDSYGRKGYAKLNLTIQRADGTRTSLTSNENIPSEGIMVGSADHVVQPGDQLHIQVAADTAGLMGVRLGYDDP